MTMTKKNSIPIKLWIESGDEMKLISNKRQSLLELFDWMDYRKLNRIDTLELFAVIIVAVVGN